MENMTKDEALEAMLNYIEVENQAFEDAGITEGTVEFECPLCGGKAIGHRYIHGGRIHGLGSGCTDCGMMHT